MQRFVRSCLVLGFVFGLAVGLPHPISADGCGGGPGAGSSVACSQASGCPPGYLNWSNGSTGIGAGAGWENAMVPASQQKILCLQAPTAAPSSSQAGPVPASGTPPAGSIGSAGPAVLVAQNPSLGSILTDPQGRTLYVRSDDSPGSSNCVSACAATWLPLQPVAGQTLTSAAPGALGTITRGDGVGQVTYNGKPLYRYSGDAAPGVANGTAVDPLAAVATP